MKKFSNLIFIIFTIVSMTFSLRASNNMLFTMVPVFSKYELSFSTAQIGMLSALFSVFTFFVSTFLNAKLTSSNRKKFFVFSAFLYFICFIMFYFSNATNIWLLVGISGFSLGALMPNIITAAGLCEDKNKRERIIAVYTITLSSALIAGPLIELMILKFVSLRESFLIFSLFPFIAFLFSFFIKFPKESNIVNGNISIIKNSYFLASVLNILIYNIPFFVLISFAGIYAKEVFNINISTINLYFSIFFASSFIGRFYLLIKPPKKIFNGMIFSGILTIIGITIIIFSKSPIFFAISLFILGFPHGFTFVLSLIGIARGTDLELRNKANSYFFSIISGLSTLTPLVFGYLLQLTNIKYLFVMLIPFILFFFALLVYNLRSSKIV